MWTRTLLLTTSLSAIGGCTCNPPVCEDGEALVDDVCVPVEDPVRPDVLWGIDANDVIAIEEIGGSWTMDGEAVDPIAVMAEAGANTFRLRVFAESDGGFHLGTLDNDALAIARRAQEAGLYVVPIFFMSRGWATISSQDAPADWADLDVGARAEAVRSWAADAARQILDNGIVTETWGIGNETDYGFCGVYGQLDGTASTAEIAYLQQEVWPDEATLLQATVEGIRQGTGQESPDLIAHIGHSGHPDFATAWYGAMRDHGLEFTMAGLSYYPNTFTSEETAAVYTTIAQLADTFSVPVLIAEYAYAAAECPLPEGLTPEDCSPDNPDRPNECLPCNPWTRIQLDDYELSEEGQAAFVRDLKTRVYEDEDLAGAIYFSPEENFSGATWSWMSLWKSASDRKSAGERPALHEL